MSGTLLVGALTGTCDVYFISPQAARNIAWDYEAYRGLPDNGKRYEVVQGDLLVSPTPSTLHQLISQRIQTELVLQIQRQGGGYVFDAPVDVILSPTSVVQPDIVVLKQESRSKITPRAMGGPRPYRRSSLLPIDERT